MTRVYTIRAVGSSWSFPYLDEALRLIAYLHYEYPGTRVSLSSHVWHIRKN